MKTRPLSGPRATVFLTLATLLTALNAVAALALPALEISERVPPEVRRQLTDDLEHLKSIRGGSTTALHRQVFSDTGALNGLDYYAFFRQRVARVEMHPSQKNFFVAAGGAAQPNVLFVSPEYVTYRKTMSPFERLAILLHEARHNESDHDHWPHATCPTPFLGLAGKPQLAPWGEGLAGKPACDRAALGSYGITYVMAENVSRACTNCAKEEKQAAQTYAENIILRITDAQSRAQLKRDH